MIIRKIAKLLYCYIADIKKNNLTVRQYGNYNLEKGFSLIEMLVVISITAILGMLGIAGFNNYNKVQVLQTSANQVVSMLNLAKSRAQSQIKPSGLICSDPDGLSSYAVETTSDTYRLKANCSNGFDFYFDEQERKLPTGLAFDSFHTIIFPVLTGGVESPDTIQINGGGISRFIDIDSLGGISLR